MRKLLAGLVLILSTAVMLPAHAFPPTPIDSYKVAASWSVAFNEGGAPYFTFTGSLTRAFPPVPIFPPTPVKGSLSTLGNFFYPPTPIVPPNPIKFARGTGNVNWSDATHSSFSYTIVLISTHLAWFGTITSGLWKGGHVTGYGTTNYPPTPVRYSTGTYNGNLQFYPPVPI